MKKIVALILALVVTFLCTACQGSSPKESRRKKDDISGTYYLNGDACYELKIVPQDSHSYRVEIDHNFGRDYYTTQSDYSLFFDLDNPKEFLKETPVTLSQIDVYEEPDFEGTDELELCKKGYAIELISGGVTGTYYPAYSSSYLIPNSREVLLTKADLAEFSLEELGFARNEILARHGRHFQKEKYRTYFEKQPWYQETRQDEDDSWTSKELNGEELANIKLIKDMENHWEQYEAAHKTYETLAEMNSDKLLKNQRRYSDFSCLGTDLIDPVISVEVVPGSYINYGDYATVEADIFVGCHAPASEVENLKAGDMLTMTTNYLTGETEQFSVLESYDRSRHTAEIGCPDGEGSDADTQLVYAGDNNYYLYEFSFDRREAPIGRTTLYLMNETCQGNGVGSFSNLKHYEYTPVDSHTFEKTGDGTDDRFYNVVTFNSKGYVTGLYYFGD